MKPNIIKKKFKKLFGEVTTMVTPNPITYGEGKTCYWELSYKQIREFIPTPSYHPSMMFCFGGFNLNKDKDYLCDPIPIRRFGVVCIKKNGKRFRRVKEQKVCKVFKYRAEAEAYIASL